MSKTRVKQRLISKTGDWREHDHVTFLGLHDAIRFRQRIEDWLPKLNLSRSHLVAVDNSSSDETVEWMSSLLEGTSDSYTFLANAENLGGYGSLSNSLPLFRGQKWLTTLHQDDEYKSEHLMGHLEVIGSSNDKLGLVCSEATSVDSEGWELGYPRMNWLPIGDDLASRYLANLRMHMYPFSGATFAVQVLTEFPLPWGQTAFPDTEIVLKMLPKYEIEFAQANTVRYLEHQASESHSLSESERINGTYEALKRIFRHDSYRVVCESIEVDQVGPFIRSLRTSISLRLMGHQNSQEWLESLDNLATRHFRTLFAKSSESNEDELVSFPGIEKHQHLARASNVANLNAQKSLQMLFLRTVGRFPRGIRVQVFRYLMSFQFVRKRLPNWDFEWRRK